MSSALDMSLDDLIKTNKKSAAGNSRGRVRGSGRGPARRNPNRSGNRPAPYSMGKAPETTWQHDMFSLEHPAAGYAAAAPMATSIELGTKLYVSNLEYGVSNEDIKELFSEVGDLKRHAIHYDRSGRSKGTAEVVFTRREDAIAAVKRYNNVQLDGKPMKVEIIGTNIMKPVSASQFPVVNRGFVNPNGPSRSVSARSGAPAYSQGGGPNGGRRRRGGRLVPPSTEALDADLDKYHSEAMQTN